MRASTPTSRCVPKYYRCSSDLCVCFQILPFYSYVPFSTQYLGHSCINEVMTAKMMKENTQRNGNDVVYKNKSLKGSDQKQKSFLLPRKQWKRSLIFEIRGHLYLTSPRPFWMPLCPHDSTKSNHKLSVQKLWSRYICYLFILSYWVTTIKSKW